MHSTHDRSNGASDIRNALAVVTLTALSVAPARAQSALKQFDGQANYDFLGWAVDGGDDVDGDGVDDVVVGALGYSIGGRAEVYSGRTGLVLHTFASPSFSSCALAGDTNGDGFADVIVGDYGGVSSVGSATVYSGLTGAVLHTFTGAAANDALGSAVAGAGDVDGDGFDDVIVGAPQSATFGAGPGYALVFSGLTGALIHAFTGDAAGDSFGYSVAGAGDVDNDGRADLIVGAWTNDQNGTDAGMARVFSGLNGSVLHQFLGATAGDWLGQSVDGAGDVNADGRDDLIVGAPGDDAGGSFAGSVRVHSGLNGVSLHVFLGSASGNSVGVAVAGTGDIDGDGTPDVAFANGGGASNVRVHSGIDGSLIFSVPGINAASVAGAGDVNGDGAQELLVGDPIENGPERGQVTIYADAAVVAPSTYCTAKVNSQGCTPAIAASGTPSASSPTGFHITAMSVINNKNGLFFYGLSGPAAVPFQGGTFCATAPVRRTPLLSSGGNSPPDDCSGSYSFDFNAWFDGGGDANLFAGTRVNGQFWSRDPSAAFGTGLTNAVEFTILL